MSEIADLPFGESTHRFKGPQGGLETIIHRVDAAAAGSVAVICHPHPLHGGTMHNKVVTTLARTFQDLQIHSVRFNYRGVGQSAGEYGHVDGECDDLAAILLNVKRIFPDHGLLLAGFSFGAYIAYQAARQANPKCLISIAPAMAHMPYAIEDKLNCPWIIVQGEADEVIAPMPVYEFVEKSQSQPILLRFSETGHFFHGKLILLRQQLSKILTDRVLR